ncbi:hypothetical protein BH11PSE13_BH11PSE13_13770 [soil metagenome]
MAVVCPACGTENRDGARFCKGCGGKLTSGSTAQAASSHANEWPATEPAPLLTSGPAHASSPNVPFEGEKTVIVGKSAYAQYERADATLLAPSIGESTPFPAHASLAFVSSASLPSSSASSSAAPSASTFGAAEDIAPQRHPEAPLTLPEPKSSNGFWIGVVLLLLVVVAGASWYGFGSKGAATGVPTAAAPPATAPAATGTVDAAPAPASAPSTVSATPAPALPSPAATAAAPAAAAPLASAPPASVAPAPPPAAETRTAPVRSTTATPAAKSKKAATAAPVAVAAAPVLAAPAPLPAPEPAPPPAAPQAECAGRNFIAMAQCMVNQCAKAEFKAHPQCDAVRKQQRIDEEKRNPSMAN